MSSFISFPAETPENDDPKLLSNIYSKFRSITSAASSAVSGVLPKERSGHSRTSSRATSRVHSRTPSTAPSFRANDEHVRFRDDSDNNSILPDSLSLLDTSSVSEMTPVVGREGLRLNIKQPSPSVSSVNILWDGNMATPPPPAPLVPPQVNRSKVTRSVSTNTLRSSRSSMKYHLPGYIDRDGSSDSESIVSTTTDGLHGAPERTSLLRAGGLEKQFWMKDENATECFSCGKAFSTWRRKHHCRICGQIFCSACTTLLDGKKFKYPGKMRSCYNCMDIADRYEATESDSDSEREIAESIYDNSVDVDAIEANQLHPVRYKPLPTPTMAIPTTRLGEGGALEIMEGSSRPSSSRFSNIRRSRTKSLPWNSVATNGGNYIQDSMEGINDVSDSDHAAESESEDEHALSLLAALQLDRTAASVDPNASQTSMQTTMRRPRSGTNRSMEPVNIAREPSTSVPRIQRIKKRSRSFVSNKRLSGRPLSRAGSMHPEEVAPPSPTKNHSHSTVAVKGPQYPTMQLNAASIRHTYKFCRQLLEDTGVANVEEWTEALIKPVFQCCENTELDVRAEDSIDIRNYIKIKRVIGGAPKDTFYLQGLVFTSNIALKGMPSEVSTPRVLVITFPVEYARPDGVHVISINPVVAQEKEFLKKLVKRIIALRPSVIVSSSSVAGFALQLLSKSGIAVVHNVKDTAIQRVSRYTGADVCVSKDQLAHPRLGHCELFSARQYVSEGVRKSYIIFSGCPREMGCTIVLRGPDEEALKLVVEFMVYVVFNLKLETSLLRDQLAMIPNKLPSTKDIEVQEAPEEPEDHQSGYFNDIVRLQQSKILSSSPLVQFELPYLLTSARDLEDRLVEMDCKIELQKKSEGLDDQQFLQLVNNEMENRFKGVNLDLSNLPRAGIQRIVKTMADQGYQRLYDQWSLAKYRWELMFSNNPYMFSPSVHQNLVVLYSMVNIKTATPCLGPQNLNMDYYSESDITLGHFIENVILSARNMCSEGCGRPLSDHFQSYVHGHGRLNVVIEPFPCRLPGLENQILMWSYCKICKRAMPAFMPMSENTWKYSFGKYLELTFWGKKVSLRASACPHNLYRDHIHYFGLQNMAVRFEYSEIDLLEIVVPRAKTEWDVTFDIRHRLNRHAKIRDSINKFCESVMRRLLRVKVEGLTPERFEEFKTRASELKERCETEREEALQYLDEITRTSSPRDYLRLNAAVKYVQQLVVEWENEFTEFEQAFFPSEKDITRITAQQLRRIFLDEKEEKEDKEEDGKGKEEDKEFNEKDNKLESKDGAEGDEKIVSEKGVESNNDSFGDESTDQSGSSKSGNGTPKPLEVEGSDTFSVVPCDDEDGRPSESSTKASSPVKTRSPLVTSPVLSPKSSTPTSPLSSPHVPQLSKPDDPQSDAFRERMTGIPRRTNAMNSPVAADKSKDKSHLSRSVSPTKRSSIPILQQLADRGMGPPHAMSVSPEKSIRSSNPNGARQRYVNSSLELERQLQLGRELGSNRVSSLAKHFDQLSREFEKERAKERKLLAASRFRALPVHSSKPIVDVYKSVQDAVEEEESASSDDEKNKAIKVRRGSAPSIRRSSASRRGAHPKPSAMLTAPDPEPSSPEAHLSASVNKDGVTKEVVEVGEGPVTQQTLSTAVNDALSGDLHQTAERQSLMKTLASFWADRSATGWDALEYPLAATEHIFADSDVIVREDEPSSLIAFCLSLPDYKEKIRVSNETENPGTAPPEEIQVQIEEESPLEKLMLKKTSSHLRYQFQEGSAKLSCKVFYAEQFDAFRRHCKVDEYYVQSLSRCVKWDSRGGKSGSAFLKTLDDRLVVKQLSPAELDAFLSFAPSYFDYMARAFFHDLPTVIAKLLGFYQILIRNTITGVTVKMDVLVMENLFYQRKNLRIFDLKGSMRNRHVQQTGKDDEVLLDENMVEYIYESPLFVREHAKKLLRTSLYNDTLFLAKMNVMDYSLVIGIDSEEKVLVVGIIDIIRTFTWDKKLESWVKERGLVGGGAKEPTVVTPRQYKNRFREAMERYILMVPDCYCQPDQ
ncbi:1-phosphatidylinositol 3-phosphate 5-kinase fab1 [Yarrowia sp. C11]|nr:1-phosphatidylinositol 3-phosphate 5-kinase fab1 [Yarrowia sp. C11]KAG5371003.1 1-phosphatidylinositol 3-phosphate 5-kinase fab1 [Yarrowia sp. E02]